MRGGRWSGASNRAGTGVRAFKDFKASLLQEHESIYFRQLMAQTCRNLTQAAQISGLCRAHVRAMVRKYRI